MKTRGEVVADIIEELVREVVFDMNDKHNPYDVPEVKHRLAAALDAEGVPL